MKERLSVLTSSRSLKFVMIAMGLVGASAVVKAALPSGYEAMTAQEKYRTLMAGITSDGILRPMDKLGAMDMAKLFFPNFLQETFLHVSDELPLGRKKLIHTYGGTAGVMFKATNPNSPYTGVFETGAYGVMRISIATPDLNTFAPGLGLKLLINGRQSVSVPAMFSLEGQGADTNPFRNAFRTDIDPPRNPDTAQKLLLGAFKLVVSVLHSSGTGPADEVTMPLDEFAAQNEDGTRVRGFVAPYSLEFVPTAEVTRAMDQAIADSGDDRSIRDDFRSQMFKAIAPNTVVYKVYAREGHEENAHKIEIGEIVALTRFIHSRYQDEKLFFKHPNRLR